MKIHIATEQLIVFETESEAMQAREDGQTLVRSVLQIKGLEQWPSIELEEFTYGASRLFFARPVRVYLSELLAQLCE